MEIKINKEIRQYRESVFFGLIMRQFICAILAVGAAVGIYFGLKPALGDETVSWVCIIGAAPIAAAGFFQYNGMTLEKFLWAVFKSEFLFAGRRVFKAENIFYQAIEQGGKKHGQTTRKRYPNGERTAECSAQCSAVDSD